MWRLIKRRNTRVADENMHMPMHVQVQQQQPGDQDAAGAGQSGIGRLASTVGALLALILHWVDNSEAAAAGVHMAHEWQRLQSDEVNTIIVQDSMRYAIYV
ncbi:hypothetical protein FCM35_KLT17128 [Carex littledalei]|uniref:Uncharacterized protein n=1 Tax=Carex littledalei TaxID=544730 RepID=A0A833VGV6_9POAL|nr:hypothetical protein FCM35_KLT17128 [Carex littledalei]